MSSFSQRRLWPWFLTLCIALWGRPALAATIFVDADCTLTDAILSANLDSEISSSNCEVGNGDDLVVLESAATYAFSQAFVMRGWGDISALPEITSTLTISGNGATIQRAPELNTCHVLHLGQDDPEQFRLFEVGREGSLTLNDVIVENGCAASGGGIHNSGTLTVIDSTIRANTGMAYDDTIGGGGGIYNEEGDVTLIRSQVISNTNLAGDVTYFVSCGGGLHNFGGTLRISNSTVARNHVVAPNGGGGICNLSGELWITGSSILSNTTGGSGGAIASGTINDAPALVQIIDSDVLSNTAMGSGGGIDIYGTTLAVERSRLNANHAEIDGGGLSTRYSSIVTLLHTQMVANSAGGRGGAVFSRESALTIHRVSLLDNIAGNTGGALYQALPRADDEDDTYPDGNARVTQSRILGNSSVALYSEGETVAAVDNWWGHADGPSGEGDGDGDSISDHVQFEPFKVEDFPINAPPDFRQLLPYILKE